MQVRVKQELKILYPNSAFGSLIVREVPNKRVHEGIEKLKRKLEKDIRENYPEVGEDAIIQYYDTYFSKWGRTYPIKFQLNSIKKGENFPQVSTLVDCMFLAELKDRILTSGHDLDDIIGDLVFDISKKGESYTKINGKEQSLKGKDIVLRDEEGILASVLYGPAKRTSIKRETKNALYFAWCPTGINEEEVKQHLKNIKSNLETVYPTFKHKIELYT